MWLIPTVKSSYSFYWSYRWKFNVLVERRIFLNVLCKSASHLPCCNGSAGKNDALLSSGDVRLVLPTELHTVVLGFMVETTKAFRALLLKELKAFDGVVPEGFMPIYYVLLCYERKSKWYTFHIGQGVVQYEIGTLQGHPGRQTIALKNFFGRI